MHIITAIVVQSILIGLALFITILRCWIRVRTERRRLTLADYLVWCGWFCSLGWVTCSIKALNIQIDHPLAEDTTSDSIAYLKTVFISCYFFDVGLYFPKASLIAFYWWLIPRAFQRLRMAIYVSTAYLACAFIATLLTDIFIAPSISDNWSLENQLDSTWNSLNGLIINWAFNFSTDLMLFALPFFMITCLKLRRRQKIGLVGVFSLGGITIAISLARFIFYTADWDVDDASGNTWSTAEMSTSLIVVSLPALKSLIMRSTPNNTSNRSVTGYMQAGSGKPKSGITSHIRGGHGQDDDEMELTFLERKASPTPTNDTKVQEGKEGVMITTNVTVTREGV